jgi:biotin synthase-like enzyme
LEKPNGSPDTLDNVASHLLFEKPLLELLFEAQQVHRQHFDPRQVQVSTLLSIKTGPARKIANIVRKAPAIKPGWMRNA